MSSLFADVVQAACLHAGTFMQAHPVVAIKAHRYGDFL
jgi:hypothetical protein